ncbi:hypothetical protein HZH68_016239 [Vespula germanica]|uniref:Uncharacterized protein n=1 Tax=Vespula germanica TaxID=30212 RepID=A0A834MQY0_VESGE|nr:hypothetical protein HZH68_016239 [Vespula germanica]
MLPNFQTDLMMATGVLLYIRGTLGLLTAAILKNLALHVIRHLMCQIVKTAEEADAAYEFITNIANNLKPKLVLLLRALSVWEYLGNRKRRKSIYFLPTKFAKTNMALFYKAWNGGKTKWEGFTYFKGFKRKQL